jgi:undecaprenyl pyrophosphate phosphatase UppP
MQLGLWHLNLPYVRFLRRLSAVDWPLVSVAMIASFMSSFFAMVHYHELIDPNKFIPQRILLIK